MRRLITMLFAAALAIPLLSASPADAAARVRVANPSGAAKIDPVYATSLKLSGRGFQSIRKGHGGIYVMFAAVKGTWRPSQGGSSGNTYFSVPDEESANNRGYAKFIAFPGSDTASSANGGTISANGTWSTSITVPGAVFQAYGRDGRATTIDCRKDTCGVLSVGAHGVVNARNETFTPVAVGPGQRASKETPKSSAAAPGTPSHREGSGSAAVPVPGAPTPGAAGSPSAKPVKPKPATLEVDRGSARAGRVLSFSATGLRPGSQVSASFANGLAGAGPLTVGTTGELAGVLRLPAEVTTGTYDLRLVGSSELPSVNFAVVGQPTEPEGSDRAQVLFVAAGMASLLLALAVAVARLRRSRHA